ncbi:hypothetical protein [Bradyrhizobium sp. CCBAU 53380]|uniref:hypothetical protein n=1 Tax=Bradyrhizobium sp. CCBAU 53380 TaxID=1325117 RepID=UPI0023039620|nr:hypothetical protein [Bradyrhizobium sp. CCBAU 53380]
MLDVLAATLGPSSVSEPARYWINSKSKPMTKFEFRLGKTILSVNRDRLSTETNRAA